ncbi:hypothetical protein H5410_022382 [Solanum commersonii]|uniref:DUF4283 domain-containing protein n=1 Tax=Solanum commersonii TaxID=4109 RepID=A0A9J5ZFA1_SOLCO|nr:hypothetical protein H5410_022382 [Solanum commersonii]
MIVNENLQYAVVGKFSYGWPDIQELRKIIPKQCGLKGECNIGLLTNIYVLIRATLLEDYVNLLSKPVFYLTHQNWSYTMRTLKIVEKWVKIKYDYMPKYYKTCMIQGHDEEQCYVEHPELHPARQNVSKEISEMQRHGQGEREENTEIMENTKGREGQHKRWEGDNKEERFQGEKHNKEGPSKKVINQVWSKVGVKTTNKFDALNDEDTDMLEQGTLGNSESRDVSTKQWVEDTFSKLNRMVPEEKDIEGEGEKNSTGERKGIEENITDIEIHEKEISENQMQELEEDEEMEENIQQISRVGDLSPRHVNSLKRDFKKGKAIVPLQVKTRSKKDWNVVLDQ